MLPLLIPAAVTALQAGASIFNNINSAKQQNRANQQSMDWQEKMYGIQRRDSLSDWAMENEYNSPKAQMKRLKDANLNPNLVYGSGADAQGGSVRSSSPGSYNAKAPETNLDLSGLNSFYDMRLKDAQKDNLQSAKAVQDQDVILKAAQTQSVLKDVHTKDFDLKMKNELKDINVDMAKTALDRAKVDTDTATMSNYTQGAIQDSTIDKAKAEAKKALNEASASDHLEKRVLQELENLKKDGDIKEFQRNLAKLGITQSDNVFLRIFTTLFGKFIPKP